MHQRLALPALLLLVWLGAPAARGDSLPPAAVPSSAVHPYPADLLERVRQAAGIIPGSAPTSIHYVKVAESLRPMADVIEGGSQETFVSARSAFQVMYAFRGRDARPQDCVLIVHL
ncbi:MAG: hypothetical protein ACKO5F_03370 [Synechococcus sp.]